MNEEEFIRRVSKAIKQELGDYCQITTFRTHDRIAVSFEDSDDAFDMSVEKQ